MNATLAKKAPSITNMIRIDHGHVMAVFHRYRADVSPGKKAALVRNACLALQIHAQLEEEIFYPALQGTAGGEQLLGKSMAEHGEMKRLITGMRELEPGDPVFDERFLELMRIVIHHVADEETILLPAAENLLRQRLGELGVRMTKRRLELLAPHAGEIAATTARSFPAATALITAATIALGGRMLFARRRPPTLHRH
jgi:hemerythrin superfamily protein